jgi:hypothetical protein
MLGQTATETHPSQLALFPRKYRSKRQRPCDLCRSRKTQCKISSFNAACELCMRLERNCTFVLQPLRKKRRQSETENATAGERQASLSDRSANALSDVEHPGSDIIDMDFGLEALLARQGSDPISPFNVNRTPNSDGLNWPSLDFASGKLPPGRQLQWKAYTNCLEQLLQRSTMVYTTNRSMATSRQF